MVLFPVEGIFCLSCSEKHWSICAVRKPGYVSAGAFPVTGQLDVEIPECWIVSTSALKWEETHSQQMYVIHCRRRSRTPGFWAGLDLSVLLWTSASPVPGPPLSPLKQKEVQVPLATPVSSLEEWERRDQWQEGTQNTDTSLKRSWVSSS